MWGSVRPRDVLAAGIGGASATEGVPRAIGDDRTAMRHEAIPALPGQELVFARTSSGGRDGSTTVRTPYATARRAASREDQDLIAGCSPACDGGVRKPADFVEAVRQLGLYRLLLNETPAGHPRP